MTRSSNCKLFALVRSWLTDKLTAELNVRSTAFTMRIAFVAQPFDNVRPPVRGGSLALWIYYMAGICAKRGHQTFIFGNQGDAFRSQTVISEDIEYHFTATGMDRLLNRALSTGRKLLDGRQKDNAADAFKRPVFLSSWHHRGYARAVARKVRQLQCDVVHIMNYSQLVPVIRKAHPRAIIALHMQCEWLTQLDVATIKPRLEQTDLIVGCSEYITRKVAAAFPEYAARCVTVPNAADIVPDKGEPAPNNQTVLFVGRLSPEKGVHDLIVAFRQVLERVPEARLSLVGGAGSAPLEFLVGLSDEPHVTALRTFYQTPASGPKDPYLEALEREAGPELGKRIIFEGVVKHDRIEDAYRNAALLVNPSLSESFGISLVEAMMRGIPVVATRIGGMSYTVDPEVTGLLVEPANPAALSEAICRMLSNPGHSRQMGEAGRQRAIEMFSWSKTADILLEHFHRRCQSAHA